MFTYAVLGITGFNTLLYIGLQDTTATNALLINSSVPILIVFMSAIILKQKISNKQIVGIMLSTIGVVFLVLKGDVSRITTLEFNKGDFWVILTGFVWAFYSVIFKFKPKGLKDMEFVTAIVYLGTAVLFLIYLFFGYGYNSAITVINNHYMILLYVILFPSILSYIFWHRGIMEIGADKTGQFTHLMPIFGSFLAFIFLGETLEFYHLLGISFIGFGIYLSLFFKV
jgi:drug/metabolite transporter (DMT)-like permease